MHQSSSFMRGHFDLRPRGANIVGIINRRCCDKFQDSLYKPVKIYSLQNGQSA